MNSDPCCEFIVILDEDLALYEMCIEAFAFGEYLQDLLPCLDLVEVPYFIVVLKDMLLIVASLSICGQHSQLSLCNQVLVFEWEVLDIVHL